MFALLLSMAIKAQNFSEYFTVGEDNNHIELNISDMPNADMRFCLLSMIANDENIAYSIDNDRISVFISSKNGWDSETFLSYFDDLKSRFIENFKNYSKASKDTQGELFITWKNNVSQDLFVLLFKLNMIENSEPDYRDGNQSCATSEPFCTSDIITFHVDANPSGTCEPGPNYGCLSSYIARRPYWYHMKIRTAGAFTIRMTSSPSVDIDYCCWGPFNDPVTPCPSQLQNIIDCGSSGATTETCQIPSSSQVGQYYIMVITKWNQGTATDITFQKVANSGPGETDCSILDPFLTANTPCVGSSLVLQAEEITGATYSWTGPDNQTHNGRVWNRTNATLNMAGLYTCHVVSGQQSADETLQVVVLPNVTSDFTFGDAIAGVPVQFTGTETTNPSGHTSQINVRQWNFGDGTTSTSVNPSHTYSNPGDYQVTYSLAITGGEDGECSDTKTKTVQVRNQLSATVSSENGTSFCEGDAIPNLRATANGGFGNYTYSWTSSPQCQIDYPNSATTTAHPALGTTTFTCTISDNHSTVTETISITVNAIPDATITGPNPPQINYGASTTLSAPQLSGASYEWSSSPANLIQSGQGTYQITTKNLTVPTTFYVTVSKNGCSETSDFVLAVGDELFGSVTITGQPELCAGESTTLSVLPVGGTEQYSFNWQPENLIEGSHTQQSITTKALTASTAFTCTITDTDNHTYTASSPTVVVNPMPEAVASCSYNNILAGNYVLLSAQPVANASCSWEPAELISDIIDPWTAKTIDLPENENTVFTLTVTTANGCWSQDEVSFSVYPSLDESTATTNNAVVCQDNGVTLTAHPVGGTGSYSYYWEPAELVDDPYAQVTTAHPTLDNHMFTCMIKDNGIDDLSNNKVYRTIDIEVHEKPHISSDLLGRDFIVPGLGVIPYIYEYNVDVLNLHGFGVDDPSLVSYVWSLETYDDVPNHVSGTPNQTTWILQEEGSTTARVLANAEGYALLKCTIMTPCGITETKKFIYTNEIYYPYYSTDEVSYDDMVKVYPNPTNGEINIKYCGRITASPLCISIYSYNGTLIEQIEGIYGDSITSYSMNGYANGLYLIRITGKDFSVTKRFILNR